MLKEERNARMWRHGDAPKATICPFHVVFVFVFLLVFIFVFLKKHKYTNDSTAPCSRPKAGRFKICGELAFPFVSAVLEPDLHLMLTLYNIS